VLPRLLALAGALEERAQPEVAVGQERAQAQGSPPIAFTGTGTTPSIRSAGDRSSTYCLTSPNLLRIFSRLSSDTTGMSSTERMMSPPIRDRHHRREGNPDEGVRAIARGTGMDRKTIATCPAGQRRTDRHLQAFTLSHDRTMTFVHCSDVQSLGRRDPTRG
jgi:hypothetical protein